MIWDTGREMIFNIFKHPHVYMGRISIVQRAGLQRQSTFVIGKDYFNMSVVPVVVFISFLFSLTFVILINVQRL